MRKVGATLLSLPVLAIIYLAVIGRSVGRLRAAALLGFVALIILVVASGARPAPGAAVPPASPRTVEASLLDQIRTGHPLTAPFTVGFDASMDPASVAAAVRLSPDAAVSIGLDATGRTLTLAPVGHWAPDTLYTITVDASAKGTDGAALTAPVRAAVLTAGAGSGSMEATAVTGDLALIDTAFRIHLDRPVAPATVEAALRAEPAIAGTVAADGGSADLLFTPAAPLKPGTKYHLWLDGLADKDGVPFATAPSLLVTTVDAPQVVRFRPRAGTADAAQNVAISVRFTEQMDRKLTGAAFAVTADGRPVTGKVGWAEQDHVLLFTPAAQLPYGATVAMTVGASAASRTGVALETAATGSFTVLPKPVAKPAPKPVAKAAPKPVAKPVPKPAPKPKSGGTVSIPRSGGSGAVAGTWLSVEQYYIKLMNCTRTGGWVTSSGACSSPGGRNVAALTLNPTISSNVSRPYAQYLAVHGLCNHFYGGTPADRLRHAGFTSYHWGENIGCEGGNPFSAVLGDHQFFQSERPYNGGHYRNIMDAQYSEAGVGVWVSAGRVRLVIDFYHP